MTELSHDARALIEQGRSDDPPTSEDRARIRRRLTAELGGGAFATVAVAGVVASASPASAMGRAVQGGTTWLKSALVVTAMAGGAVVAYVGARPVSERSDAARTRATSTEVAPAIEQTRLAEPSSPSMEMPVTAPPEAPTVPSADTAIAVAPAMKRDAARSRRSRRAAVSAEAAAVPPANEVPAAAAASVREAEAPSGSVTAELALLAEAQRALRVGDAHKALALSQQHREQFARGALVEERAGIETLARCKLGEQPEASARAFLARSPSSPLAARVRKECGLE